MPFSLCNAPGTFQRCMMAIFHDMIEKTMEVFMDDFWSLGIHSKIASLAWTRCSKGAKTPNLVDKLGEMLFPWSRRGILLRP
ncbi:hypothetical protein Tco_1195743 [Tanacetum coccineum]